MSKTKNKRREPVELRLNEEFSIRVNSNGSISTDYEGGENWLVVLTSKDLDQIVAYSMAMDKLDLDSVISKIRALVEREIPDYNGVQMSRCQNYEVNFSEYVPTVDDFVNPDIVSDDLSGVNIGCQHIDHEDLIRVHALSRRMRGLTGKAK